MSLSEEVILQNFNEYESYIDLFANDKKEGCQLLIEHFKDRLALAPASGATHFHGAYPGGLIVHKLYVIKNAIELYKLFKKSGSECNGYTKEELIFSAWAHDLGKLGNLTDDYFIPCEDRWQQEKQGKTYIHNPRLINMRHSDRSLYLLSHFKVPMTENEFLAINIHDGPLDEKNEFYFKTFDKSKIFKNNLPMIIHMADYMSYRIELEIEHNHNTDL